MFESGTNAEFIAAIKTIGDFCFSRDDETIFYITNLGEYHRVWAIPSGGGYPRRVDFLEEGDVVSIKLSPDGEKLALCVDRDGREEYDIYVMPSKGGKPEKITDKVTLTLPAFAWSPDSSAFTAVAELNRHNNILTIDIEQKKINWLTETPDLKMQPDWSGDGEWICYTSLTDSQKSDICMVNIRTHEIKNMTDNLGCENKQAKFSPDGRILAFTSNSRGIDNVVLMDIESRSTMWISQKEDCEQTFLEWNGKGDHFSFLRNEDAEMTIHETDYPPTQTRRISTSGYYGQSMSYDHNGAKVAVSLSSPSQAGEIYIREGKTLRKLTNSSVFGLSTKDFVNPKKVRYPSSDGRQIPALYYKPKINEKYPVILWLHGGPKGQHFNRWDSFIQLLVTNGIAVLAPNPRGSSGYGQDYENGVYHDWGGMDLEDVIAGVEFLKQDAFADLFNITVGGMSYGGYLSTAAAVKHPEIWSAAVNIAGPVNLKSFYQNSSTWLKSILEQKYGFRSPEEDPDFYEKHSPINSIGNIQCPMLLVYGRNDPRVPITELAQIRDALKENQKDFEESIMQLEGHSLNRFESRVRLFNDLVAFIKKHIRTTS